MGAIKSFRKLKGKSLAKRSEVSFKHNDEIYILPLKSIGVLEQAEVIDLGIKPPTKQRKATQEERDEYLTDNPEANKALMRELKVLEFDYTDEEYIEKMKDSANLTRLIDVVRYIDLSSKVSKEKLWENLGLESAKDYVGLVKLLFNEWELDNTFLQRLTLSIKSLSNDPFWVELQKLDGQIGDKSWFELLPLLTKAIENENSTKS